MPMDSRSRTTKCLRLVSHPCFETIIAQNEDTHLTKQPQPKTQPELGATCRKSLYYHWTIIDSPL